MVTNRVTTPQADIPIETKRPVVIGVGNLRVDGKDGDSIRVAGANKIHKIVGWAMGESAMDELFGEDPAFDTGTEMFDRDRLKLHYDKLGVRPKLEKLLRWARRATTEDEDVKLLHEAVAQSATPPTLAIAPSDKAGHTAEGADGEADEDAPDNPQGPTADSAVDLAGRTAFPDAAPLRALVADRFAPEPILAQSFSQLMLSDDQQLVAEMAVLNTVLARVENPTREGLIEAIESVRLDVETRLESLVDDVESHFEPVREGVATMISFLEEAGESRDALVLIHYTDIESTMLKEKDSLARELRRHEPSADIIVANTFRSPAPADAFTAAKLDAAPEVHGTLYVGINPGTLEAAMDLAAEFPVLPGFGPGHEGVWLGVGEHVSTGVLIGAAGAIAGLRSRLDNNIDPTKHAYGYAEALAGIVGGSARAMTSIRDFSTSGWHPDDARELTNAGLNTLALEGGLLVSRSARSRSSLPVYEFVDLTRFGDLVVGSARGHFARSAGWRSNKRAVREYEVERFREEFLGRLRDHAGARFTVDVEDSPNPGEFVIRVSMEAHAYITTVVIINERSLARVEIPQS